MLYRNKNAKLVILKQNGCQLMENAAKRKEEEEEEEDDDLIRFHLVCVSVEFYSCGMG